jgi:hypothetical protein
MLAAGALGAETYVRGTSPCYEALAALIARGHPWTLTGSDVAADAAHPGLFLRLHGDVRVDLRAKQPAAHVIGRVQVGAAIEGPLVFWTVLLAWPRAARGRRVAMLVCGLPMFVILETGTTACQLLAGFAQASAMIAGDRDPLTLWERWSRLIESGGRDVLAVLAALLTVMLARVASIVGSRPAPSAAPGDHRPKVAEGHR